MGNLDKRLAALEQQRPASQPEQRPLTEEEMLRWVCFFFQQEELQIDDAGAVVVNHAKLWPGTVQYDKDLALLTEVAGIMNEWRQANPGPFLPLMPDDGAKALELMQAGRVFVNERKPSLSWGRIIADYKLGHPHYAEACRSADMLGPALTTYNASGGIVEPFTNETIIELLAACVENEAINRELPLGVINGVFE